MFKRVFTSQSTLSLNSVLDNFNAPIRYAVAYGSGAFAQKGYGDGAEPMVDFIFGVTHPQHWHSLNLRQHPEHYSSLHVYEKLSVDYNPDVIVNGMRIKYGVVSMHHLERDLEEWETLYLAGRLHKPLRVLRQDAKIGISTRRNLENAVRVSLLMLPERFTEEELYLKIAGLSYRGDFRMKFGENPHKVFNIVYAQMDAFREKYESVINDLPNVNRLVDSTLEQDLSPKLRGTMIQHLPKHFVEKLKNHYLWALSKEGKRGIEREEPLFTQRMGQFADIDLCTEKTIREIVGRPALVQSIKGIATAGFFRSFKYAGEKLSKFKTAKK